MSEQQWTREQQRSAWRYLEVCRADPLARVPWALPEHEAMALLRQYRVLARRSVAAVERAWAREQQRRGLGDG